MERVSRDEEGLEVMHGVRHSYVRIDMRVGEGDELRLLAVLWTSASEA